MTKEEVKEQALALGLSGELVPLSSVRPNPKNPRVMRDGRFEKLKQSIREFPKMLALRPMVTEDDGMVLGGNMRQRALKALGYGYIPKEWVKKASDLTEDEKRRFIAIDNESFGEWDMDALANEWDTDELKEWGVDGIWDVEGEEQKKDPETKKLSEIEFNDVYYTPENKPMIRLSDCIDTELFEQKMSFIETLPLNEEQRRIMEILAYRFIKIDFQSVADYYAFNASEGEMKALERLRCVLVDGSLEGFIGDRLLRVNKHFAEEGRDD